MRTYIPEDVRLVPQEAQKVFTGDIYDVYQWEQELYDGTSKTFEMLKRPDTVDVIGVTDDGVLINYEEQPSVGSYITFPGGRHDKPEESELAAAKREMKEETGYEFSNWKLISAVQLASKIDHLVYTFVATGGEKNSEPQLDSGERIETKHVPFKLLQQVVKQKEFKAYSSNIVLELNTLEDLLTLPAIHEYH